MGFRLRLTTIQLPESKQHANRIWKVSQIVIRRGSRPRIQLVTLPDRSPFPIEGRALPESMVVCDRARGTNTEVYVPCVALVGFEGTEARVASFQLG